MFGIGFEELIVILIIALIVVGPERMPELARKLGTTIRDLRRMYDNLRADLGPDYEEIERGIQMLRSMDPRRELDTYGRKFIGELAKEVGPEAESLVNSPPSQLTEVLKQSFSLSPETAQATAEQTVARSDEPGVASEPAGLRTVAEGSFEDAAGYGEPRPRKVARVYPAFNRSDRPGQQPVSKELIAHLGHDLLSDNLLDRPLREAVAEQSSNGHEPA